MILFVCDVLSSSADCRSPSVIDITDADIPVAIDIKDDDAPVAIESSQEA